MAALRDKKAAGEVDESTYGRLVRAAWSMERVPNRGRSFCAAAYEDCHSLATEQNEQIAFSGEWLSKLKEWLLANWPTILKILLTLLIAMDGGKSGDDS